MKKRTNYKNKSFVYSNLKTNSNKTKWKKKNENKNWGTNEGEKTNKNENKINQRLTLFVEL